MTETEKAYLAGIIDGEGWVAFTKRGYIRVKVKMSSEETILYFKKITKTGCIYAYSPEKNLGKKGYKILYTWQASYQQAVMILGEVMPYLVTKKSAALVALELNKKYKEGKVLRNKHS